MCSLQKAMLRGLFVKVSSVTDQLFHSRTDHLDRLKAFVAFCAVYSSDFVMLA
jgi:hypothetical protein